jgi:hypothetical protein
LGFRVLPAETTNRLTEGGERGLISRAGPELAMPRKLAALFCLALIAALLLPQAADAATSLNQVIDNMRTWILGLLVALATLLLTIGGVRYLLAAGDPGAIEKAKGTIKAAIAGYALAALAPVLVTVVGHIVGA